MEPVLVHIAAITVADAADGGVVVHTADGSRRGHLSDAGDTTLPPQHYLLLRVPRGVTVGEAWEVLRACAATDDDGGWAPAPGVRFELHEPTGVELYLPVTLPGP
jgi:hypothetical protein